MRAEQTVDLGLERSGIAQYLDSVGYWGTPENRSRNDFVLSPSAYVVSYRQREDLERLSRAAYEGVMSLAYKLKALAWEKSISNEDAYFLGLAKSAARGLLSPAEHCGRTPPVLKVDLVQDEQDRYWIAEVDVYNPRGFGFLALLNGLVPQGSLVGPGIPGMVPHFDEIGDGARWTFVVSEFERYYLPAYTIFANALKREGIDVSVLRENDLATGGEALEKISHVLAISDTMSRHPEVRTHLLSRYKTGELQAFYPPVAYLGSKAFLPHLRELPGLQEFIPASALVSRKYDPFKTLAAQRPLVLKGVMASGHKEVIFQRLDAERFCQTLAEARKTKSALWMAQEEVTQASVPVVVFDERGKRCLRNYYLRATAYVSLEGLIGVEVTGRQSEMVHGAPDCIQIPCVMG